jgi:hypothetical protein
MARGGKEAVRTGIVRPKASRRERTNFTRKATEITGTREIISKILKVAVLQIMSLLHLLLLHLETLLLRFVL